MTAYQKCCFTLIGSVGVLIGTYLGVQLVITELFGASVLEGLAITGTSLIISIAPVVRGYSIAFRRDCLGEIESSDNPGDGLFAWRVTWISLSLLACLCLSLAGVSLIYKSDSPFLACVFLVGSALGIWKVTTSLRRLATKEKAGSHNLKTRNSVSTMRLLLDVLLATIGHVTLFSGIYGFVKHWEFSIDMLLILLGLVILSMVCLVVRKTVKLASL